MNEEKKSTKKTSRRLSNIMGIALGATLLLSFIYIGSNTYNGSFTDPKTGKKLDYQLINRSNSRSAYIFQPNCPDIFPTKIRDLNKDGWINHVGTPTYPRIPFEFNILKYMPERKQEAQRLYELILDDYHKNKGGKQNVQK